MQGLLSYRKVSYRGCEGKQRIDGAYLGTFWWRYSFYHGQNVSHFFLPWRQVLLWRIYFAHTASIGVKIPFDSSPPAQDDCPNLFLLSFSYTKSGASLVNKVCTLWGAVSGNRCPVSEEVEEWIPNTLCPKPHTQSPGALPDCPNFVNEFAHAVGGIGENEMKWWCSFSLSWLEMKKVCTPASRSSSERVTGGEHRRRSCLCHRSK